MKKITEISPDSKKGNHKKNKSLDTYLYFKAEDQQKKSKKLRIKKLSLGFVSSSQFFKGKLDMDFIRTFKGRKRKSFDPYLTLNKFERLRGNNKVLRRSKRGASFSFRNFRKEVEAMDKLYDDN